MKKTSTEPEVQNADITFGKYLDCSTGHMTYEDSLRLGEMARSDSNYVKGPGLRVVGHEYGWWVLVPCLKSQEMTQKQFIEEVEGVGLSKSFAKVVLFAYKNGCRWINFDRDGDPVEGLRYFEW